MRCAARNEALLGFQRRRTCHRRPPPLKTTSVASCSAAWYTVHADEAASSYVHNQVRHVPAIAERPAGDWVRARAGSRGLGAGRLDRCLKRNTNKNTHPLQRYTHSLAQAVAEDVLYSRADVRRVREQHYTSDQDLGNHFIIQGIPFQRPGVRFFSQA